jgi:hypothetical protein
MDKQTSTSISSIPHYQLTVEQIKLALHHGVEIAEKQHMPTSLSLLKEIYAALVETAIWCNSRPNQPADREFVERMAAVMSYAADYAELIRATFAQRCMIRLFIRLKAHLGFIDAQGLVSKVRAACTSNGVGEDSLAAMCLFCGIDAGSCASPSMLS